MLPRLAPWSARWPARPGGAGVGRRRPAGLDGPARQGRRARRPPPAVTASHRGGWISGADYELPGGSVLTVGPVQVVEADQRAGQLHEPPTGRRRAARGGQAHRQRDAGKPTRDGRLWQCHGRDRCGRGDAADRCGCGCQRALPAVASGPGRCGRRPAQRPSGIQALTCQCPASTLGRRGRGSRARACAQPTSVPSACKARRPPPGFGRRPWQAPREVAPDNRGQGRLRGHIA